MAGSVNTTERINIMDHLDEAPPVPDTPAPASVQATAQQTFAEQLKHTKGLTRIDLIKEWRAYAKDKLPDYCVELGAKRLEVLEASGPTFIRELARHTIYNMEMFFAQHHMDVERQIKVEEPLFPG